MQNVEGVYREIRASDGAGIFSCALRSKALVALRYGVSFAVLKKAAADTIEREAQQDFWILLTNDSSEKREDKNVMSPWGRNTILKTLLIAIFYV